MKSCLYTGEVTHARKLPKRHRFKLGVSFFYLDLDELEQIKTEVGMRSFRRGDYHGDPALSLQDAVRYTAEKKLSRKTLGPIRMLTQIRQFGYVFNPVTFYYVFKPDESALDAIVTEITNIPWLERHVYVHDCTLAPSDKEYQRFEFEKEFHVSPFMEMNHLYKWAFKTPNETLSVLMENYSKSTKMFDVALRLKKTELSKTSFRKNVLRYPFMSIIATVAIYFHAALLKMKGVPFYTHPKKRGPKYVNKK